MKESKKICAYIYIHIWASQVASSMVKNLPASARDAGLIPGSGRSREGNGTPLPVYLPGKSHGQRTLAPHYSPWGHEESDVT